EPEPEPVPEPEQPAEKAVIHLTFTRDQIEREETVVIRDACLIEPLQMKLRKAMKDGMKLRLTNANVRSAENGAKRTAVLHLHVVGNGPSQPAKAPATIVPPAAPAPKATATRTVASPTRKTVSFAPVSSNCAFQLCREGELKTGFQFGGADDEGTVEISPSEITVYKKSKAIGLAFGAIGNAIAGKGSPCATIRPAHIASYEKNMRGGRFQDYRIHLKDGRLLKLSFISMQLSSMVSAADAFLSQV
ncbi:MAG: hypothetical protein IKD54_00995, partial [Clostridia bacterium]|nr:hypothetical protein [Clostridia bacterium]